MREPAWFADVTIGTARLQRLLRDLGARSCGRVATDPHAPALAVVVPEHETHMLGAMVLGEQLGRLGASVQIIMGKGAGDVATGVADQRFDAVFLSVARTDALASVRNLVDKLRQATERRAPIVVGGAVVEREREIVKLTGADHVATDARDALTLCGLRISPSGTGRRAAQE